MWTRANEFDRMFGAMNLLRSRMNRLFNDFDGSYGDDYGWNVVDGAPKTNLYDNGDQFKLIAEVPGFAKEDISVRVQGNYLELSASANLPQPEGYTAHRRERIAVSSFTRSFTLPADVDVDRIEAMLKDGLLVLSLPKAEAAKPKQITIS